MSSIKNSVQLIGNIGSDINYQTFESGTSKASFTVATNEYYKNNKGEKVKDTEWHNIVAWGKTAELINQLTKKGAEIMIHGKITNRSYTDKSGETKYITEIVANEFYSMQKMASKTEN